jgi:hypothetical protein
MELLTEIAPIERLCFSGAGCNWSTEPPDLPSDLNSMHNYLFPI